MEPIYLRVNFYPPLESGREHKPLATADLNSRLIACQFTTNDVNGFEGANLAWTSLRGPERVGRLPKLSDLPHHAHVEIKVGNQLVWEGRLVEKPRGGSGRYGSCVLQGYYGHFRDNWVRSSSASALTTNEALEFILSEYLWLVSPHPGEHWETIGRSTTLGTYYKMKITEAIDQIRQAGTGNRNPVALRVWENRWLHITEKIVPETPHYRVPYDERYVNLTEHSRDMYSHVSVEYGDASTGTVIEEDETENFQTTYGFRAYELIVAGDVGSTQAAYLRDVQLAKGDGPVIQGSIDVGPENPYFMTSPTGVIIPFYMVRAGQWVQIAQPEDPDDTVPIIGTSCDMFARSGSFELGDEPDPRLPKNQNWAVYETTRRHQRHISKHGGRWR